MHIQALNWQTRIKRKYDHQYKPSIGNLVSMNTNTSNGKCDYCLLHQGMKAYSMVSYLSGKVQSNFNFIKTYMPLNGVLP